MEFCQLGSSKNEFANANEDSDAGRGEKLKAIIKLGINFTVYFSVRDEQAILNLSVWLASAYCLIEPPLYKV